MQNIRNISVRIRFFSRVKQNERKVGLLLIFREKKNLSKIKKNQRKIFFYGEKFIFKKIKKQYFFLKKTEKFRLCVKLRKKNPLAD